MTVGHTEIRILIRHLFAMSSVGRYCPTILWGEAGVGKSEAVKTAAKNLAIDFVDLRLANMEAPDLLGTQRDDTVYPCLFCSMDSKRPDPVATGERYTKQGLHRHIRIHHPEILATEGAERTVDKSIEDLKRAGHSIYFERRVVYSAPMWFPEPDTAGILFLDEMNRSQRDTRQGIFQLSLDRRVHELELPPRWIIMSACNPPDTGQTGAANYDVDHFDDAALISRFCHLGVRPRLMEWIAYAREAGIDESIRNTVALDEKLFEGATETVLPAVGPTPRTWVILSELLSDVLDEDGGLVSRLAPEVRPAVLRGMLGAKIASAYENSLEEPGGRLEAFFDVLPERLGEAIAEAAGITDEDTLLPYLELWAERPGVREAAAALHPKNPAEKKIVQILKGSR